MTFSHFKPNYKLEISKRHDGITSFAGLGLVRESISELGLIEVFKEFKLKEAGYGDEVCVESFIMLMSSGGRSLSDWEYLSSESGFSRMVSNCPSVDTLERYLRRLDLHEIFYDKKEGKIGYCRLLEKPNDLIIKRAYEAAGCPQELTIDLDASIFTTSKREALFCYDSVKAYQPMIAYCPELKMVLAHEFRDGNVSPTLGYQRLTERVFKMLPGVRWRVRGDSAGYQLEFLDYLAKQGASYYVTVDQFNCIKKMLKKEKDWQPYVDRHGFKTNQETCELSYVPHANSQKELRFRANTMRYVAIRKPKSQQGEIFEDDYVYQVVVTNEKSQGLNEVIHDHWGRCGSVEYCYSQLKEGCGIRRMPSKDFAVNAAWFSLGILTHNLLRFMQEHILPEKLRKIEIQTLRFRFLRGAAWVITHAREITLRFCRGSPLYEMYQEARQKLRALAPKPQEI